MMKQTRDNANENFPYSFCR